MQLQCELYISASDLLFYLDLRNNDNDVLESVFQNFDYLLTLINI